MWKKCQKCPQVEVLDLRRMKLYITVTKARTVDDMKGLNGWTKMKLITSIGYSSM